ncbi:45059_t:CDS:2, partial [Gigaspora margarita]
DCSFQTNKKALHYIHIYKDSKCSILENQEDQEHNYKNLSSYFFKQSFTTYPIPEKDTNQKFAQLNNTETTTKQTAFYLYSHIKAYFKAVAQNDNISKLGLEQALEKTIVPTIDPYILARI